MFKDQRRQEILNLLRQKGYVEVSELCRAYKVTEMTIRRDLEYLSAENPGILRKRGGAVLQTDKPYEDRACIHMDEKDLIAHTAVSLLGDSQTIFMDSGTTLTQLSKYLPDHEGFLVVTNSVENANELLKKSKIRILLIGGELDRNVRSTRGILSEEQMRSLQVDIAFLGANAVGMDGNVSITNTVEISFKKAVLASSKHTYVLADSSKMGKNGLLPYVHGSQLTGIVTDNNIPRETRDTLHSLNINLIIANE